MQFLRLEVKSGLGPYRQQNGSKDGDQDNGTLVPFQRNKEETWVGFHTGTCNMARKMWTQMVLLFCFKSVKNVRGEPWDGHVTAVINSIKNGGSTSGDGTIMANERDEMATEWTQKSQSTLQEKCKFVTFGLGRMQLSMEHREKKSKGIVKKIKEKTP